MKSKKVFRPCDEDYDFVYDSLLGRIEDDTPTVRVNMLSFILKHHPRVFWESYSDGILGGKK
jgi:hypothetical protein